MVDEVVEESVSQVEYFKPDLLPIPFGVVFSKAEFMDEVKRYGVATDDDWLIGAAGSVSQFESKDGDVFLLVFLDKRELRKYEPHEVVGVIAHESMHVYQYILEAIGEEAPGKELEAYIIQWIVSTLYQCLKTNRKKHD